MKSVPFVKYTSCGNKFVIVDEISQTILAETEKMKFAYQATDMYFGIGSDNFIVIQAFNEGVLNEINAEHHYWESLPQFKEAKPTFIFRMFEPDGKEAYSCGNGLLCVADYLYHAYHIQTAQILTQIPAPHPKPITIGVDLSSAISWSNMGPPELIPPNLIHPSVVTQGGNALQMIQDFGLTFSKSELIGFQADFHLELSGYIIYTGEPHLVIFTETGISSAEFAGKLLESSLVKQQNGIKTDYSSWIVHEIGMCFNRHYPHLFPQGLNVNFVRVVDRSGIIEQRSFERGVNRETWACGTGAVAAACVARQLELTDADDIQIWPYLGRLRDPHIRLGVKQTGRDYTLYGKPFLIFKGVSAFLQAEQLDTAGMDFQLTPLSSTAPASTGKAQFVYGESFTLHDDNSITFHYPAPVDLSVPIAAVKAPPGGLKHR